MVSHASHHRFSYQKRLQESNTLASSAHSPCPGCMDQGCNASQVQTITIPWNGMQVVSDNSVPSSAAAIFLATSSLQIIGLFHLCGALGCWQYCYAIIHCRPAGKIQTNACCRFPNDKGAKMCQCLKGGSMHFQKQQTCVAS